MRSHDATLLGIFETEQKEIVERIRTLIGPAEGGGAPAPAAMEEALRRTHTLKGAARAVGLASTERIAHAMEAVLIRIRDGGLKFSGPVLEGIQRGLEAAEDVLAAVVGGGAEPDVSAVAGRLEALRAGGPEPKAPPAAPPVAGPEPAGPAYETVRVPAGRIDELVRSSVELLAAAGQVDGLRRLGELAGRASQAGREYARLRQQATMPLRAQAADPEIAPVFECLDYAAGQLAALSAGAEAARSGFERLSRSLRELAANHYQDACAVRMVPAETVFGVFRRMVRELAADEGKQIEFRFEGAQVEADRLVLQRLKDPVMHLLRNAVSHGCEPPEERAAAGKPRQATVWLTLETPGDRLEIAVRDDGRGVDLARVAETAIRRGLLASGASPEPQELTALLLQPGFTTSEEVTELAGRGLGLSVVQQEVAQLRGELSIDTGPVGVAIRLSAPLSISAQHILLAGCGGHTVAFPSAAVERLYRIRPGDIQSIDGGTAVRLDGRPVPLARLDALLGLPEKAADGPALPVVVLRSGKNRVGLLVDSLIDERQALVKDLGLPAASAGMTIGGVPLEGGEVAVVLDPAAVVAGFRAAGTVPAPQPPAAGRRAPATILVVDDSLTTRSLEKNILEAAGYRVRVAVDGLEALESLRRAPADLVIADVMMPRMDGFQLLEQIKRDRRLGRMPVIIVTSLERREEQERGLTLGAEGYIVKRKFDQRELLDTVRQIVGEAGRAPQAPKTS